MIQGGVRGVVHVQYLIIRPWTPAVPIRGIETVISPVGRHTQTRNRVTSEIQIVGNAAQTGLGKNESDPILDIRPRDRRPPITERVISNSLQTCRIKQRCNRLIGCLQIQPVQQVPDVDTLDPGFVEGVGIRQLWLAVLELESQR
ncbi:hypothetical protein D3C85_879140 [compost metagenome]